MHQSSTPYPPLYDPRFEHDACGTGFVARIDGWPGHDILALALESVIRLTHRGAVDADAKTGDGAGVLTQIPRRLVARELERLGVRGVDPATVAVAMVFFPKDRALREQACRLFEQTLHRRGLPLLAWRQVPTDPSVLGDKALSTEPEIQQAFIARPQGVDGEQFERLLYLARKEIEKAALQAGLETFYIPSMSGRTVVYKGLFVAPQLRGYYRDLTDPDFETALAVFHQRYSTNTFPNWILAQPFRMLAHNGEINTLQGNRNWMKAREPVLSSRVWGDEVATLIPVCQPGGSDSASLDNVLELLTLSGRHILHSLMMLIPEAWENMPQMEPSWRAFYEYHACLTEPWDGPAAIAFTDGITVGATLDRNGLRPARYTVTEDGLVLMASEVGVVEFDPAEVVEKGRLGPGQMIAVDTAERVLRKNNEIKDAFARRRPYALWNDRQLVRLHIDAPGGVLASTVAMAADDVDTADGNGSAGNGAAGNGYLPNGGLSSEELVKVQKAFGYTAEEIKFVLETMGGEGKDPVWSMGDDAPLAVLSTKPRHFSSYFRQRFAQVTNPPIDPLRETLVMSLDTYLGPRGSLLEESEEHAHLLHLDNPLLEEWQLEQIRNLDDPAFKSATLSALFDPRQGPEELERAVERLCRQAEEAVDRGCGLLIISDRGVDATHAPIPSLLATAAVHHHLIRTGRRMRTDIIVEAGDAWDVHHLALLLGYGAGAICPYTAWYTVLSVPGSRGFESLTPAKAIENYRHAVDHGLLKIMSKMGISALAGYRGAQIFEAIGLAQEIVDRYFTDTPSRVGGIGLKELGEDIIARHRSAFGEPTDKKLPDFGFYRFRRDGEYHGFNPFVVRALQKAAQSGDFSDYRAFSELVNARPPMTLRDLLTFKPGKPIPLEEVEPMESIRRRFTSQAMSLGALSPEAHRTLAIAMNRIGCRSNTGEGGEDPDWWKPLPNGDIANCAIKQVASARFGVTIEYLAHAAEIEIKMAQGSKPGEGGQLPAHKVTDFIARLRHAIRGIPLISPPPHHDIYSIEDLAQLIYDLKQANPEARVGVKLVSEMGVGTIAAGVAKAYADYILISGSEGGTGASPLSSIKNAGLPWELGLAETQQVLVMNDLRGRVVLRTDGGLKNGRDVVIAAMLGAEEFGFGTAAIVAMGCDMARQCHLNTCPTGIATQRPELRARFKGTPEMVINFFTGIALEVREILASLGFRSLDEIIGRVDLLELVPELENPRARLLDLSAILAPADPTWTRPRLHVVPRNDRADRHATLDVQIIKDAERAIETGEPVKLAYEIRNDNRAVGARLSYMIARNYGDAGLPDGTIDITFRGSAGQSFGAFTVRGVRLTLEGEANDYVGKGLTGGEIIIKPPRTSRFRSHQNVIMGNTVLYGATGGWLFAAGRAGERFAVRNSGAQAVVEGTGDHCCEYMTAGLVVVLGETGRNFGAGMAAGTAYVLDELGDFEQRYNPEMVSIERVTSMEDRDELYRMIALHLEKTGSRRAQEILEHWDEYLPLFWKVVPHPPVVTRDHDTYTAFGAKQEAVVAAHHQPRGGKA